MELLYVIIGFIIYVWLVSPKERTIDELKSKQKDDPFDFTRITAEDFIKAAKKIDNKEKHTNDQSTSGTEEQTKVSILEAKDYISILLSSEPIDNMTAYYMRQENDRNLYFTYINKSPHWRFKRETRFNIDKGICQSCGKTIYINSFHCHHLNYTSLFNEDMEDLISLCYSCHQEEHNHQRIKNWKQ